MGRAIPGWQSYGSWAYAAEAATAEYLLDERLRVHPVQRKTDKGLSALEGIQQIRNELSQVQHVVRLVGLSGVGKTRMVQALFDERVGEHSIDPSLAIFANMADDPNPQPIGLASDLVATGIRVILVIDNCPSELHGRLSEVCRQSGSRVSLITVEYDIREDEPEGTEVFTLEGSSPALIEKLVRRRFSDISQVDAHTIADFSGGNARIAIALAATIGHNETVAGLTDEQLFQRLFLQRHAHDDSLYLCAQACALVYSFQGEDVSEADEAELVRLGRLVAFTAQELYRLVAELQRRDLVQQRGVWRAILPQAIANRLAATALQNVPYAEIERHIMTGSSARLMRSFARRLGYLHASKEAVDIVKKWLGVGGMLENAAILNNIGRAMFENVAPCAPEDALAALERALLGPLRAEEAKECQKYCSLLRCLAYEPELFERCVTLMVKILTDEDVNAESHGTQLLVSLFHLVLSGTHASIEQRATVIKFLLTSQEAKQRALGVLALKASLEAFHFNSVGSFEFGARPRDFGYWPRTKDDVQHWFSVSLSLVKHFACGDWQVAEQVSAALAEKFRWLLLAGGCFDELVNVCKEIGKNRFWPEGWRAVRQALELDGKGLDAEHLAKLVSIEEELRPIDLVQKVRAVVFSTSLPGVDLDDFDDSSSEDIGSRMARSEAVAEDLGKAVAGEQTALTELLPELVLRDGRLWSFGQGLVEGSDDVSGTWSRLVASLATTEASARKPHVLCGFLHQLRDSNPILASTLLDEAVQHETLAGIYPFLQVAVKLGDQDVERLKRSVKLGKAPAAAYRNLAYGRATDPIPALDLQELVLAIAGMPSGYDIAIEIFYMRLHSDKDRKVELAPEFVATGRQLIQQFTFTSRNDRDDYEMAEITKSCLHGEKGASVTTDFCRRLKRAVENCETNAFYHDDLLVGLFSAQPIAALEGLCGGDQKELELGSESCATSADASLPSLSFRTVISWAGATKTHRVAIPPLRKLSRFPSVWESTSSRAGPVLQCGFWRRRRTRALYCADSPRDSCLRACGEARLRRSWNRTAASSINSKSTQR